ncbi:MAG TPA: acetolactate synthase 2 catalytic subunit [Rhodanobacteraceae bacterium]
MQATTVTATTAETLTGAQWVLRALEDAGVDTVFGYPGGAIMPVYDALVDSPLKHVLTRHEQGAALAADGYARASGRLGVCLATSGPGATNLLTGIANAALDSVPMLAITGQVGTSLMGTDAFQEVDVFGMSLPVVKHSWIVRDAADVYAVIREAAALAQSGRPGPVLVDLPKNVANALAKARPWQAPAAAASTPDESALERARVLLRKAQRPVLYVGGGVVLANAEAALRAFAQATGMPTVSTLKGLGAADPDSEHYLGMLGMHGLPAANYAVHDADLLVVVGARFDDRATGRLDGFAAGAQVIHLDADPAEIGKLRHADVGLAGDLAGYLKGLAEPLSIGAWQAHCVGLSRAFGDRRELPPGNTVYAPALLHQLSLAAGKEAVVACDVGQHQMWVAQHWHFGRGRAHLTSAGLGTMGYGLPAAIGAQLGCPQRTVICVSGDGSIMMNVQELATLKRYGLPVKIVLLDNGCLGMVRQWQQLFNDGRYSEVDLSDNPDFAVVAKAFGIESFTVDARDQVDAAIERLLATEGPVLCHVKIDPRANVWPLVPPGATNADMMEEAA